MSCAWLVYDLCMSSMFCVSCVCLQFLCRHSMSCMSCVCLQCFAYLVYVFSFFVGKVCLLCLVYVLCMSGMFCVSCVCLQFLCRHSMSCVCLVYVLCMSCVCLVYVLDVLRILCMSSVSL